MKCYIVIYDLQNPIRNYENLVEAIKSYGTWGKITKFSWAILTNDSAAEIRDYLNKYIEPADRIFIIKSGKESAWRNTIAKSDWLKKYLIFE